VCVPGAEEPRGSASGDWQVKRPLLVVLDEDLEVDQVVGALATHGGAGM